MIKKCFAQLKSLQKMKAAEELKILSRSIVDVKYHLQATSPLRVLSYVHIRINILIRPIENICANLT